MTNHHPIDVAKLLEEQLATASPDLLRSLLSTFIAALMSAEADALCGGRLWRTQYLAVQSPQRVSVSGFRYPHRHHRRGDPQAAAG